MKSVNKKSILNKAQIQARVARNEHLSFSFACGGWLKMYMFGVAQALQELNLDQHATFLGSSAGSLTATGLYFKCDFRQIRDYVVGTVVPAAHSSLRGAFRVREYLLNTIRKCGKLHLLEAYTSKTIQSTNELVVVYSSISRWKSRRKSSFADIPELEQYLLASCCATPIAGLPFYYRNEWVFDGGLFDFQPVLDNDTITVNPFYCTNADIKPSRYVPMWWAIYPPAENEVKWLFELGYEDALRWAQRTGLVSPTRKISTTAFCHDHKWNTTLGRCFGYRALESKVLDTLFILFVICLWKPLAFLLLYAELISRALIFGSKAALCIAATKFLISVSVIGGLATSLACCNLWTVIGLVLTSSVLAVVVGIIAFVSNDDLDQLFMSASTSWRDCLVCMRTIGSLSLFLRSIPFFGSSIVSSSHVKRHEKLLEHSFIYRMTYFFV